MSNQPRTSLLHICLVILFSLSMACGDDVTKKDFCPPGSDCESADAGFDDGIDEDASDGGPPDCIDDSCRDMGCDDGSCEALPCMQDEYVSDGSCVSCPPGTAREAGDLPEGPDTECAATLCETDEYVADNQCVSCPAGSSNTAGDDASGSDTQCDVETCERDQKVDGNRCVSCPAGTRNEPGDEASAADTTCDAIQCGADERVLANACAPCPAGSTNSAGDLASGDDTTCDPIVCSQDEYVSSNACRDCPAGSSNNAGDLATGPDTGCDGELCASNQRVASNTCVACPAGTTNAAGDDATGADTNCDPVFCAQNQRARNNTCVSCPAGTTNAAGDRADGANTTCDAIFCAANERVRANLCVACPAGSTNPAGDDASGGDTFCAPTICGQNQRVIQNACVACPAGSTNAAGDSAQGPNTACDPIQCAIDEKVVANQCVACPDGTTNQAGDLATGANTTCDPVICALDEYVLNHQCVACTSGETNPAGDDASGPDTTCETIVCGFNEFVSSNTCTPCPAGLSNDPGDIASGPDTMCEDPCMSIFGVACTQFEEAYIKASNPDSFDYFGSAVAASGDTLVVGAYREGSSSTGINGNQSDNSESQAGAAYVFVRSGTTWTQEAYLKASNAEGGDHFGRSVAIDGDRIVVGAPGERSNATRVNGVQSNNQAPGSGAAYVFDRSGTTWTQTAYLKASNAEQSDEFGAQVAVSGTTVAVSAIDEGSSATGIDGGKLFNSAPGSGAVYIFEYLSNSYWTDTAYIKASNTDSSDEFGTAIALEGDTLVVGAPDEDSNASGIDGNDDDDSLSNSGAVYIFFRSNGTWAQQAYVKASNPGADDAFGRSIALHNNRVVVGAPNEDSDATGIDGPDNDLSDDAGAAYVFVRSGTSWTQEAYVKATNTADDDHFGSSVAIRNDDLLVGALSETGTATGLNGDQFNRTSFSSIGAVYYYQRAQTGWSWLAYIKNDHDLDGDLFGTSVAIGNDWLAVGARGEDGSAAGINGDQTDNGATDAGAVYTRPQAP